MMFATTTPCATVTPFDVAAAIRRIDASLERNYPHLDALYKDIHAHPELAFQESRTAALLAGEMRKLGFEVTEHVGGTGVVAIYRNGAGPTVLVRTELDALPMEEKTGLPYASHAQQTLDGKPTFVDHSCGHDSHMSWWVGTAAALVGMKDQWKGTLFFVGQPAEETISGAKAMLADGLFTRFPKPDVGFAAHVGPEPLGEVDIKDGVVSSASDSIQIVFHGRGAHGSMPDRSIDPIVMGANFVTGVQDVVSRQKDPKEFGVVTVGSFQAGTVENIIPDSATLKLTLRSYSPTVRKLLVDGVERTATATAAMSGAPPPDITTRTAPPPSTTMVPSPPAPQPFSNRCSALVCISSPPRCRGLPPVKISPSSSMPACRPFTSASVAMTPQCSPTTRDAVNPSPSTTRPTSPPFPSPPFAPASPP